MNLLLDRASGARAIPGNRVSLLRDGPETYEAMLEIIAGARHWIHFENYIIRDDTTGRRFADALAARARQGIRVKVLYDWLGSVGTARRFWRDLRAAGIEVRCFNPPSLIELIANLERDHRKLVVADGFRAVMGGLCIGDEWMGDPSRNILPWRDTAVEIIGPAAEVLDQAFARTWVRARGGQLEEPVMEETGNERGGEVRVLAGEPGRERTYRILELLATGCVERLWITDAYMVPPPRLFQAIVDAARAGADIRMLVPGSSDVPWIRNLTRIGYRTLLRTGVRIWEWEGPMLHAKTLVADGRWVRVGSSNLNASSLLGNYELDVLIEDTALAASMEAQFRRDLARSREVQRAPRRVSVRLQKVLPSALRRESPELTPPLHHKSVREVRRRAVVALWTLATGARRSIYGPISLLLILLGGLFLVLPQTMAYVFGGLCAWFAIAAGMEAFRRRRES